MRGFYLYKLQNIPKLQKQCGKNKLQKNCPLLILLLNTKLSHLFVDYSVII